MSGEPKPLATADGVLPDPASEVLATRLDQDAVIVTARFWHSSKLKTDIAPVSAAILAVRNALDDADIELGGATNRNRRRQRINGFRRSFPHVARIVLVHLTRPSGHSVQMIARAVVLPRRSARSIGAHVISCGDNSCREWIDTPITGAYRLIFQSILELAALRALGRRGT